LRTHWFKSIRLHKVRDATEDCWHIGKDAGQGCAKDEKEVMMWFEQLTGFQEQGASQVRQILTLENGILSSKANGASYKTGMLETPSLSQLQATASNIMQQPVFKPGKLTLKEVVADVQSLHASPENTGALFQVASQFNLLEMASPAITPDSGVTNYQFDRTQGPACAMACGAGLIYRNYFVPVNGEIGQTAKRQLNMLDDFEQLLLTHVNRDSAKQFDVLWHMKNGYALPTAQQLTTINNTLAQLSSIELAELTATVKIGVQYDSQVTLKNAGHTVTQAYCSAMPVAYSQQSSELWQPLASLILQAAYQATLAAGVINAAKTGNNTVYLTLLGGGAFGNSIDWIITAIVKALDVYKNSGLKVNIVSYGRRKPILRSLLTT